MRTLKPRELQDLTFLKSFREQQPQFLAASMPITSIHLMLEGVPRAPKAPAGCSVLDRLVGVNKGDRLKKAYCVLRMAANPSLLNIPVSGSRSSLNAQVLINASWIDSRNIPSKFPSCNVTFVGLKVFQFVLELLHGELRDRWADVS